MSGLYSNNDSIFHSFRHITTFTVYVTACDLGMSSSSLKEQLLWLLFRVSFCYALVSCLFYKPMAILHKWQPIYMIDLTIWFIYYL